VVPVVYAKSINQLSEISTQITSEGGEPVSFVKALLPWPALWLSTYIIQGGAGQGLLSMLISFLWYPVQQRSYGRVSARAFAHLMELDLQFHVQRKTGEVVRKVNRGSSAVQTVASVVIFTVGPQALDIVSAAVVIWAKLSGWISAVVFVTTAVYIPLTVVMTDMRMKARRELNEKDNEKSARLTDALLNYETVKYFTNEERECDGFRGATEEYLSADFAWAKTNMAINTVQRCILSSGLVCGTLLCVRGVAAGEMSVGDVVLFVAMLNQLAQPLNSFGNSYRTIQRAFVDMENIFEILEREPLVKDEPGAPDIEVTGGAIRVEGVSFGYAPGRDVLRGVNLDIAAGSTVALVGETGSGKSTLLRLLLRFFDPRAGTISIDGTDISKVTQRSLRRAIGVVPQDCVLFNGPIALNIAYGGPAGASVADIERATREAQIHDHIMERFPQGYDTVVGERGVRLSGGEKQRIAVARTLMKDPRILILDEATAALDTITERAIQAELRRVSSTRTTVVVAHRLSTVLDADKIVVFHAGEVVEEGSHPELVRAGGRYAAMWSKQLESEAEPPPRAQRVRRGGAAPVASAQSLAGGSDSADN